MTVMVIGLACRVDHNQPIVAAVRVARAEGQVVATVVLDRVRLSMHHDQAQQLLNLSADLDALLKDAGAEAVVIRTIESWGGRNRAPHEPSTRIRLWVEGVMLAAARRHVESVEALTGQMIGVACEGRKKEEVEAQARELVGSNVLLIDACAAGLAALARVESA